MFPIRVRSVKTIQQQQKPITPTPPPKKSNTSNWGPQVWTFFHVLAAQIKSEEFQSISQPLINIIIQICSLLPCPDCSHDASHILSTMSFGKKIQTKEQFIQSLYTFHNTVNKKLKKPQYDSSQLSQYNQMDLIQVFRNFLVVFHTKGNMQQLTNTFHRNRLITSLKQWMSIHIHKFQRIS